MRQGVFRLLLLLLLALGMRRPARAADWDKVDPAYKHASSEAYERWRDLKYGLRIHWGIYSLLGAEASWPVLKMPNEKKQEYFDLYKKFNPTEFDASKWMGLFERCGLRFFAFTAKHHDGFSMFDTKARVKRRVNWVAPGGPKIEECDLAYSIMEGPFRRDIVKELTDAAHQRGIACDLYFSHIDWFDADFRFDQWNPFRDKGYTPQSDPEGYARFARRHREQIRELLANYGKVDMLCLDMQLPGFCWPDVKETVLMARRLQPDVLLRERGIGAYGDYTTPENWIPASPGLTDQRVDRPWMVIHTLSGQFAYDPDGSRYKSGEWIVANLIDIVAKGGNFMVSIGPDGKGLFHPEAVKRLEYAGDWLKVNGEAIYGTRPWAKHKEGESIRFTRNKDGRCVYAISLGWPGKALRLKSLRARDGSEVHLLGVSQPLKWRNDPVEGLTIELPDELQAEERRPCKQAYAFRIEGEARDPADPPRPIAPRAQPSEIELDLQTRDPKTGQALVTKQKLDATKVGIVIVDPWNYHWCMTAAQRFAAMGPRMNRTLEAARKLGMQVIWCPTDVASQYVGWPQRERALGTPYLDVQRVRAFKFSGTLGGQACMCGPGITCVVNYGWDGMNPDLVIADCDLIASGTQEIYSVLKQRGITHLIYMGGHTNMCLLGKPPALKNMYECGFECLLARDVTDAFTGYDPSKGWTPDDGTARVVSDIERNGIPSINMLEQMKRAGAWDDGWVVEAVRITPWGTEQRPYQFAEAATVTLTAPWLQDAEIRYALDGAEPSRTSTLYAKQVRLTETTRLRAAAFKDGRKVSLDSAAYFVRLPARPPGPDVFLSELKPVKRQYPHAAWFYWPKADQSYEGAPLTIRGRTCKHGLGMRAPANEQYELKIEYERFVALAGVDDGVLRQAENGRFLAMHCSVQFHVFIDGVLAAQSPVIRISQEPWCFDVKIPEGARKINLAATDAGSRSPYDLANWVEAGFVVKGSAGRPMTMPVPGYWEQDGRFAGHDGFAWYRCFIRVPQPWAGKDLALSVTAVDNCHESYFNGEKVGGAGSMPPKYANGLDTEKPCTVPAKLVRPGQDNLLAIRVYDAGGAGGFRDAAPVLSCGAEAIKLEGRWLFDAGDNAERATWPEGSKAPDVAKFALPPKP
jgi:alpha-L-fucosidase